MIKNTVIVILLVVSFLVQPIIFYDFGYDTAVTDAEPYTEDGKNYIRFGEDVHEYGENTKITVYGRITGECESEGGETYWHFKSDDDSVWWILSVEDLGHVPENSDRYVLIYDNMETTYCPHDDCECYKYDDELLGIHKM